MESLEKRINGVFDLAVYLQFMGAFDPDTNFSQIKEVVLSTYDFLKKSSPEVVNSQLPQMKATLEKMVNLYLKRYPPKKDIQRIATEWNDLFKDGNDVFSKGITLGWLRDKINIDFLNLYEDAPHHFRIGLATHKGFGGVEEEFLLKDAFNILTKAEYYYELLSKYGNKEKAEEEKSSKAFSKNVYVQITEIKYEVAACCRLTIISFYAFIESFVNSVGYSYLQEKGNLLSEDDKEVLQGIRKGRYLQLKYKIEGFQKIIRADKKPLFILSDEKQIKEPFKSFFNYYEELRNSSVHYSPFKESIWLKPEEWINAARSFSKLSMDAGTSFWRACYELNDGPKYLGKLSYELHKDKANLRLKHIQKIEHEFY